MVNESRLERELGNGFSHVVFYQTNPNNPDAVQQISDNAKKYLANIPGIRDFAVAPRLILEGLFKDIIMMLH